MNAKHHGNTDSGIMESSISWNNWIVYGFLGFALGAILVDLHGTVALPFPPFVLLSEEESAKSIDWAMVGIVGAVVFLKIAVFAISIRRKLASSSQKLVKLSIHLSEIGVGVAWGRWLSK